MGEHDPLSKLSNLDVPYLKETVSNFLAKRSSKKLSLLITGKTGVGKSRLVNALVGRRVADEGRVKSRGCTDKVSSYSVVVSEIEVLVWDSPGLQDRTVKNEDLYLEEVKQHGFNLMIYCGRMDVHRFTEPDEMAIRTLTRVFGKKVWEKTVIALTYANKVKDPDKGDKEAYFKGEYNHWKKAIDDFLREEIRLNSRVRGAISIVPAGNYRKLCPPTSENWLSELWTSCFCAMDITTALAWYQINKNRLASPSLRALMTLQRSSEDDMIPLVDSDTTQGAALVNATDRIPEVILLNKKQESTFWEKIWPSFSGYLETLAGDRGRALQLLAILGTAAAVAVTLLLTVPLYL